MSTDPAPAADRVENFSKRLLKIVGLGLLVLIGVVALGFAVFYLINVRDEPLNAAARAVLERSYDSVPRPDNLYFAVLALDPQYTAKQAIGAQGKDAQGAPATVQRSAIVAVPASLCVVETRQESSCIDAARVHSAEFLAAVSANQQLIDRYQSLAAYPSYENPVPLSTVSPVPSFQPFLAAKHLWLLKLALDVNQGKLDEVIKLLQVDSAATRRWMRQPDLLLLEKVVFAASYRQTLIFVSDLVRSRTLSEAEYAGLAPIVAPLSDDERALGGVFAREFTAYPALFQAENKSHFLKANATLNLFWDRVEANATVSRASCRDYRANTASSQKAGRFAWLGYAYNPVGKILLEVGAPLADQYIMSMCDLAGMQSIVALQVTLKAQHIADSDIETYVQRATERNPYSGAPLLWDSVGRTLRFVPVANSDGKYFPWPI